MNDVEDLVRRAFQAHEELIGDARGLADRATALARTRRRRTLAVAAAATSVVTVSIAAVLAVAAVVGSAGSRPAVRPGPAATSPASSLPSGWRWESSLGVEVAVPGDWAINDYGCGQTAASTVVRAEGATRACLTPEPPTKQVTVIGDAINTVPGLLHANIDVKKRPRGEQRLPDGRYAGWVYVPSRDVTVTVRTRTATLTTRILTSAHAVDQDHNGCATVPPAPGSLGQGARGARLVPGHPTTLAVCYYTPARPGGLLAASWSATGSQLDRLVTVLNAAKPGRNPDEPGCDRQPDSATLTLLARYADGSTVQLTVTMNGCRRGIDNGTRQGQLTVRALQALIDPLHIGFGISSDLPQN